MKLIRNVFLCTAMSISLVTTGYGHSGKTNINSGHWDNSNETYHYYNYNENVSNSIKRNTGTTSTGTTSQYTDLQNLYINGAITDIGVKKASNGTIYVQNTRFFNHLGCNTQWFPESGTVRVTKGHDRMVLTGYSDVVFDNGIKETMEHPTVIIDNIMYTPLKPFVDLAGGTNNVTVKDVNGNVVAIN